MDTEIVNKIMAAVKKTADEAGVTAEYLAKQNLLEAANVNWDIQTAMLLLRRFIYLEFGGDELSQVSDL